MRGRAPEAPSCNERDRGGIVALASLRRWGWLLSSRRGPSLAVVGADWAAVSLLHDFCSRRALFSDAPSRSTLSDVF